MKAVYKFEEEIIKEYGSDMEPIPQGYSIDELNTEDRAFIGGVLWALKTVENSRLNYCEEKESIIEKMKNEIVSGFCEELKNDLLIEAREITVSCIDGYETEEEK